MFNRIAKATLSAARNKTSQTATWALPGRRSISIFFNTAHHALTIMGIGAIIALVAMFFKPEISDHIKAFSPFAAKPAKPLAIDSVSAPRLANLMDGPTKSFIKTGDNTQPAGTSAQATGISDDEVNIIGSAREQQLVTYWLSKRYRVAGDAINMLVSAAYLTAKETKLDPLLILSVMAIESGFNPFAESPVGAQGLMQVMSKLHHEKFQHLGGVEAALNPVANIKVGSRILKEYVTRGGSVEAGLKSYVGAAAFETDGGYGSKVLAEYRRLKEVAGGKRVPVYATANVASTVTSKPAQKTETSSEQKVGAAEEDKSASNSERESSTVSTVKVAAL